MAEKILYGHDSGKRTTGYRILARSGPSDSSTMVTIDSVIIEMIQQLKLRPADLGTHCGWLWLLLDPLSSVFGRIDVVQKESGAQTLIYRLIVLSAEERARIGSHPFALKACIDSPQEWESMGDDPLSSLDFRFRAPSPSSDGGRMSQENIAVPWSSVAADADRLLASWVDLCSPEQRSTLEFVAPDVSHAGMPRLVFRVVPPETVALASSHESSTVAGIGPRKSNRLKIVVFAIGVVCLAILYQTMANRRLLDELRVRESQLASSEAELSQWKAREKQENAPLEPMSDPDERRRAIEQRLDWIEQKTKEVRSLLGPERQR